MIWDAIDNMSWEILAAIAIALIIIFLLAAIGDDRKKNEEKWDRYR